MTTEPTVEGYLSNAVVWRVAALIHARQLTRAEWLLYRRWRRLGSPEKHGLLLALDLAIDNRLAIEAIGRLLRWIDDDRRSMPTVVYVPGFSEAVWEAVRLP